MKVLANLVCAVSLMSLTASLQCKLGTDLNECVVAGDPHFTMWNGAKHDFMGQPMTQMGHNKFQDAYYYIARCTETRNNWRRMPFQIMGFHYYYTQEASKKKGPTLMDYLTFEIRDLHDPSETYFLYYSTRFIAYAKESAGATYSYDQTMAADRQRPCLTQIPRGKTVKIGNSFKINYKHLADLTFWVSYQEGNTRKVGEVKMVNRAWNSVSFTRYPGRQRSFQNVHITFKDDAFKCQTCGLCGQFTMNKQNNKMMIKECDGQWAKIRRGMTADKAPESFDEHGWTYEYNWYNDKCGQEDDITRPIHGEVEKCPKWKQRKVEQFCEEEKNKLGGCGQLNDCNEAMRECKGDGCFISGDGDASIRNVCREVLDDFRKGYYAQSDMMDIDDGEYNEDYEYMQDYGQQQLPPQQQPAMFTLNNIFMVSLIIMVNVITIISITMCCVQRPSQGGKYSTSNGQQIEFVN